MALQNAGNYPSDPASLYWARWWDVFLVVVIIAFVVVEAIVEVGVHLPELLAEACNVFEPRISLANGSVVSPLVVLDAVAVGDVALHDPEAVDRMSCYNLDLARLLAMSLVVIAWGCLSLETTLAKSCLPSTTSLGTTLAQSYASLVLHGLSYAAGWHGLDIALGLEPAY